MRGQRGGALVVVVVAMLAIGTLALAAALLAGIELALAVDGRRQAQAEALAEAGLEVGRDALREAARAGSFTRWLGQRLIDGATLGAGGRYWVRVDDDCPGLVAAGLEDPGCGAGVDINRAALVTAWTETAGGRARARTVVAVDSPWWRVCAGVAPGRGRTCGDRGDGPAGLAVTPADPDDPRGPATFDALPLPLLGCSRIDPGTHGDDGTCTRRVLTGEDPGVIAGARVCQDDAGAGAYFGYFDCALQTPCPVGTCDPVRVVRGCLRAGDTRLADPANWARYREVGPGCHRPHPGSITGLADPATGLVWNHPGATGANPAIDGVVLGTPGAGVTVYVLRSGRDGRVALGPGPTTIHGTLVVEGNGTAGADGCAAGDVDLQLGPGAELTVPPMAYGFPLALLIYDPTQPAPTVAPPAPQDTCARLGVAGARIRGAVYVAGRAELEAVGLEGSVVAFEITGGLGARVAYDARLDGATPPGFAGGAADRVVIRRKSATHCASFADQTAGPTPC